MILVSGAACGGGGGTSQASSPSPSPSPLITNDQLALTPSTAKATPVQPVPTPKSNAPSQAARPADGPYPDAMALAAADVSPRADVKEQEYVPDNDAISYKRKFNMGPPGATAGDTLGLENDIKLYPSVAGASAFFSAIKGVWTGPSGADIFTQSFESSGSLTITNLNMSEIGISTAGDGAFAVVASYDTPAGRFENEFVYVRIGDAVGSLIFTERPGDLPGATVDSLKSTLAAKIGAELAANPGA